MKGAAAQRTVLAIAGSLRRDSLNRRLLEAAAACAPPGLELDLYQGLGALPLYNEDLEAAAFASGPVRELCTLAAAAGGLLIATPEYNHSVPGVLKNALDWLSRPLSGGVLVGTPVALVGASGGRWGTRLAQAALRQTLFATDAQLISAPALYLAEAQRAFADDGTLTDRTARGALEQILAALAQAMQAAVRG